MCEIARVLKPGGIAVISDYTALEDYERLAAGGDAGKARSAYQDFFALWKDLDS